MTASFHAFYLLPQLNSDRSSRHNIFVGWNERNKVGVRDGGGAKRKRSTEIPGGPLVFQGGYHPRKKIHVIRVVFQDQTMYARTSFRVSKTC